MTDQQKRFVEEYLKCYNATKAAIMAGYSPISARSQASQLLSQEDIEAYVELRRKEISEKSLVDASWVQIRFKEISDRCMQAEPVMIYDGESWVESGEYKFDSSGAIKAAENLGKIIGVYEKDNDQSKQTTTNIINLGSGVKPEDDTTA